METLMETLMSQYLQQEWSKRVFAARTTLGLHCPQEEKKFENT